MNLAAVTARSEEIDTVVAAADLLRQAAERLAGQVPVAAFLFASTEYEHQILLDAIADRWPGLPLVGGSTDGEVSTHGFSHDSVLLTLLAGDGLRVRVGLGRDLSKDLDGAVAQASSACGERPALCWTVFAPSTNSTSVVRQLQSRLGDRCPVVGGLTGDHRESSRMVEFCGREVLKDSLPVMYLEGDLKVGCGVGTGWVPIGEPAVVTRSHGHWVHEIAGRPALDVYRDFWGSTPATDSLGEYPLAVYPNGVDGGHHLRAVLDADPAAGSIRVAGEVLAGALVRRTEVLPDGILSGSEESVDNAMAAYPGEEPLLAFVFSCAARKWVLGTKAEQEIAHLNAAFAKAGVRPLLAGGYWFGEIGPSRRGAPSEFHNESCVTVLIGR